MAKVKLRELFGAGMRAVSKYTGTVLTVFVVQTVIAVVCMFAMTMILAQQFSHLPMFDDAVDGDLISILWCVRHAFSSFLAIGGIALGAVLVWQLATWFLVGGLVGVFSQLPEGRADTARCFGASGAATYLAYARLAICSLPGFTIVLIAFGIGMRAIEERIEYALTVPQLVGPIVLASLPSLLLLCFFWTVSDYARVELSLRHESHDPGVIKTYLRSLVWVIRRPLTLVHASLGWITWWLITLAFVWLSYDHPMYGAGGAITLFFVRQVVSLLRIAVQIGVLGGQVALGRTRPLPPRRVEVKAEPKS